jgi:hypothetical protein
MAARHISMQQGWHALLVGELWPCIEAEPKSQRWKLAELMRCEAASSSGMCGGP